MHHVKQIIMATVALMLLAWPVAYAQKSKSQLSTEINTNFPDNAVGAITPAIARTTFTDFLNSWQQYSGVNAQSAATYTFQASDYGQLVTFNSAVPVAVTLPQATTSGFTTWNVFVRNLGIGTVTITPTISTINGAATLTLTTAQAAWIVSDGVNYQTWVNASNLLPTATISGQVVNSTGPNVWVAASSPTLGSASGATGQLLFAGVSSGVITIQPQSNAGTYNFNLPLSAGVSNSILMSGGGGATAMGFSTATYPATVPGAGRVINSTATDQYTNTIAPVLGGAGIGNGTVGFSGTTAGTVTVTPQASAGTYNFNLPTAAGVSNSILQSGGGGGTAMAFSVATFPSNVVNAGRVLNSSAQNAWNASTGPSLGLNGDSTGSVAFNGSGSGTVTVQPQAAAGTYNFNLPTTAGASGQFLTSQGGGATAMIFDNIASHLTQGTGITITGTTNATVALTVPGTDVALQGTPARNSAQFDKTNAALADITGISIALQTGKNYGFEVYLPTTSPVTSGTQSAIAFTGTTSSFIASCVVDNESSVSGGGGTYRVGRTTTAGTGICGVTAGTNNGIRMWGTLVTTSTGNLTAQFAQNAAGGGTSSVLIGGRMHTWLIP